MKIVYIAHPISGDVAGNLERVKNIIRDICLETEDVCPLAPYFVQCYALDDDIPEHRQRGLDNDRALIQSGAIDAVWLYGPRISSGMEQEVRWAMESDVNVAAKTEGTKRDFSKLAHATLRKQ